MEFLHLKSLQVFEAGPGSPEGVNFGKCQDTEEEVLNQAPNKKITVLIVSLNS